MKFILKDDNDDLLLKREGKGVRVFDSLNGIIESDYWVDMGLPSGTLWAKANIDLTTDSRFQEVGGVISPYTYDASFFSWGNTDGHNPDAEEAFDYTFDSAAYAETDGSILTGNIPPSQDAAKIDFGMPWRMPSTEDFSELLDSENTTFVKADGTEVTTTTKLVTINGVKGICLMSKKNGNTLFIPCCGRSNGAARSYSGGRIYSWTSSYNTSSQAKALYVYSSTTDTARSLNRYYGLTIRPVI